MADLEPVMLRVTNAAMPLDNNKDLAVRCLNILFRIRQSFVLLIPTSVLQQKLKRLI